MKLVELTVNRAVLERVIAIVNGKGGVGKTSIVANVGGLMALSGMRILLVDMDPQGNLRLDLGYGDRSDDGMSLARCLSFGGAPTVITVRQGLDVIAGGRALHDAFAVLSSRAGKDPDEAALALARVLEPIAAEYDVVLLDCPPGSEALQIAALAAARWAIIPVKSDSASAEGLNEVADRLETALRVNPELDLLGVTLFDVDSSAKRVRRDAEADLAQRLGGPELLFDVTVRHASAVAQRCRRDGVLVHELEEQVANGPKWWEIRQGTASRETAGPISSASVAQNYQDLTQEIVTRLTSREAVPA